MSKRLERLGSEVALMQDEALVDDRRRARVRRRLLTEASALEQKRPRARLVPILAWTAVVTAIVLGIVVFWPRTASPIAYRVDGGAESRAVDRPISSPVDRPVSIAFTDGSAVRLGPSALARVEQLRTDGVSVRLERGEAMVQVRRRTATRWSVEAGPFWVQVTGTRFRVAWQPERKVFDLEVFEGEVRVRGPDEPGRIVRSKGVLHRALAPSVPPELSTPSEKPIAPSAIPEAKEQAEPPPLHGPRARHQQSTASVPRPSSSRLQSAPPEPARSSQQRDPTPWAPPRGSSRPPPAPLELKLPPKEPSPTTRPDPPSQPATKDSTLEPLMPEQEPRAQPDAQPKPPSTENPAPPPRWKTLLEQGKAHELLAELGPDQVEQALWQAVPTDLIVLGAAARQIGDPRAGYIYSVARSRFPGTDAAAEAAFILGRMQFHRGSYRESATWLETYLRERPNGRLAREAAGRLVEAYLRSDDRERAQQAARRYLERYPNGPHATLCRTVLQ